MLFNLPCEVYARLYNIASYFSNSATEDTKTQLNCVRVENYNGHTFAVASNQKIAVIEYLGRADTPEWGAVHLVRDEALHNQCVVERAWGSNLQIESLPELGIVSATTTFGYSYPGLVGSIPDKFALLNHWRTWLPRAEEMPQASVGFMYWHMDVIAPLHASSPSGEVVLPAHIDPKKPIILRDKKYPNWLAIFIPTDDSIDAKLGNVKPASLPEWLYV